MNCTLQHIKTIGVLGMMLLLTFVAKGQVINKVFFTDSTIGAIDYIYDYQEVSDGIIVSGRVEDSTFSEPIMIKLNISGDVVWSSLNTKTPPTNNCSGFYFDLFDDGYIYATSFEYSWPNQYKKMWKINDTTGVVSWVTDFYGTHNSLVELADYDSTKYVAAFNDGNNSSVVAIMNKFTGDTILTKIFGSETRDIDIQVDDNKNIFYARNRQVRKFNLDDLDQLIWERSYDHLINKIEVLHKLYLDQYDDVYLFGHGNAAFGHGQGTIVKVDNQTGLAIWDTIASFSGSVRIADLVDINGKLYPTYRHTLVGGGSYMFRTAQVDKTTGGVDWFSNEMMTPITSYPWGDEQAALSLDIDCVGDLYLTGYHGDANYGPEDWGIMKLNGQNGTKTFDLTISRDTSIKNDLSVGKASCVFGNTVVILGHQEDTSGLEIDPYYVRVDHQNGNVTHKKRLGGEYQYLSRTIDIISENGTTNVLKQQGNAIVVEQYDANNNLQWSHMVVDTNLIVAGQMKLGAGVVYYTSYRPSNDSIPPYYNSFTDKLFIHKLNSANGSVIASDSVVFYSNQVFPFELEVNNADVFIFYVKDVGNYYQKWDGSSFSGINFLEISTNNISYQSELNLIVDNGPNTYLAIGSDSLYSIDKSSLIKTSVYGFPSARNYHSLLLSNDSLFAVGNNQFNSQLITAINTSTMTQIWEQSYQPNGTLYKIVSDSVNNLYVSGTTNNSSVVHHISPLTGSIIWSYIEDSIIYPNTIPYDLTLNESEGELYLVGANLNMSSTDVLISTIDLSGNNLFTHFETDEIGKISQANTIAILPDTSVWVGGSLNTISDSKRGFIYEMETCVTSITAFAVNICQGDSILIGGVYQNTQGIYNDTVQTIIGCDSVLSTTLVLDPLPSVNIAVFNPDTVCVNDPLFALPAGSPTGGVYSGNGIVGSTFNPVLAGVGTYNIIYSYTDSNSCVNSDTTVVTVASCVGLNELSTDFGILIYPNPNTGQFTIEKPKGLNTTVKVKLLDATSKLILDKVIPIDQQKIEMDITNHSKGIYYLQLIVGEEVFIKQILKN